MARKPTTKKRKTQALKTAAAPVLRANDSSMRSRFAYALGKSHGGARNLYEAFGYPLDVTTESLWGMYQRNDIAGRIVRAFPAATWREAPIIRDARGDSAEPGTEGYSPFVEAVEDYFDRHNLFRVIERADRLASIGRYGVLFLGFNDDLPTSSPRGQAAKLLFAQPYGELGVTVNKWCTNVRDPRFGLPELYTLNAAATADQRQVSPKRSITAHWSRVIHISEFVDQDDTFGVPRLLPIFNRLMDLEKVVGGSAESFWLNANRTVIYSGDSEMEMTPEDVLEIKKQAEELSHQTRRSIIGQGIEAQSISIEQADPEPNATILLDLIAGGAGMPKRILLGTERGELSSAQDENNWSSRIEERRINFATPSILRPLVTILIETGELPEPEGAWWVEWPDNNNQDPEVESRVAMNRASALATYANSPGAEFVVPMQEFRKDVLGLTPESDYPASDIPDPLPDYRSFESEEETPPPLEPRDNAEKKSLYVRRDLLNVKALSIWAKKQGITLQDGLHVTVMYSHKPVDWTDMGQPWTTDDEEGRLMVHPGGARRISLFRKPGADTAAVVLEFPCDGLEWRHREMAAKGAEHSFSTYRPHLTLFYTDDLGFDVGSIEPYQGAIALGPEVFEETK